MICQMYVCSICNQSSNYMKLTTAPLLNPASSMSIFSHAVIVGECFCRSGDISIFSKLRRSLASLLGTFCFLPMEPISSTSCGYFWRMGHCCLQAVSHSHTRLSMRLYDLRGFQRHKDEVPYAFIGFNESGTLVIWRITFVTYHPEKFLRGRALIPSQEQLPPAFRERMIDMAFTILYGAPIMPAFLSSCNYVCSVINGLITL